VGKNTSKGGRVINLLNGRDGNNRRIDSVKTRRGKTGNAVIQGGMGCRGKTRGVEIMVKKGKKYLFNYPEGMMDGRDF